MDPSDQVSLREPPEGFLTPRDGDRVVAIIDDPGQVNAAIEDLVREGFDQEEIVVLSGAEGAARLTGGYPGLLGRLFRFAEHALGEEPEERERYARELAAGRFLIAVPADEQLKSLVAQVLARHGAHDMEHFGRYHGEPLGSLRDEVGS
jgi:hypothetical protein